MFRGPVLTSAGRGGGAAVHHLGRGVRWTATVHLGVAELYIAADGVRDHRRHLVVCGLSKKSGVRVPGACWRVAHHSRARRAVLQRAAAVRRVGVEDLADAALGRVRHFGNRAFRVLRQTNKNQRGRHFTKHE